MIFEIASQAASAVYTQLHQAYFFQAMTYAGAIAAIGFAAMGSAYGCGTAGAAAVGAWKKCYAQNKPAPFLLLAFAGAPLSQTIYGMIVMFVIMSKAPETYSAWMAYLATGVVGGIAIGISALWQGIAAAAACDAYAENGKGFANQLMILGIVETIAIFVMAFAIVLLSKIVPLAA